jgi:hypothetical protein
LIYISILFNSHRYLVVHITKTVRGDPDDTTEMYFKVQTVRNQHALFPLLLHSPENENNKTGETERKDQVFHGHEGSSG